MAQVAPHVAAPNERNMQNERKTQNERAMQSEGPYGTVAPNLLRVQSMTGPECGHTPLAFEVVKAELHKLSRCVKRCEYTRYSCEYTLD